MQVFKNCDFYLTKELSISELEYLAPKIKCRIFFLEKNALEFFEKMIIILVENREKRLS